MMGKRKNANKLYKKNGGFSLLEVIIAMGILSIVSLIILRFMSTSSDTYSRSSAEVDIQEEAQLVANSIKELIIDCQVSTMFFPGETGYDDGTNNYPNALLVNNNDEQIIIYQDVTAAAPLTYDDELKYVSRKRNVATGNFDIPFNKADAEVLGQYISDFNVDTSSYEKNKMIEFSFSYKLRKETYTGKYQVYMRNDIVIDSVTDYESNDKQEITQVIVSPPLVTISPSIANGELAAPQQFVAVVRASGALSTEKTWAIDNPDSGCQIDQDGLLTVVTEPEVDSFHVVATSVVDNTKTGASTVRVKKVTDMGVVAISGIVGEVGDDQTGRVQAAAPNSRVVFAAIVNGWNLTAADQSVLWKLEYRPNYATGTNFTTISEYDPVTRAYVNTRPEVGQISAAGMVTLGRNATTNYEFRITATSTFPDYGTELSYKSATALLRIKNDDVEFNGKFVRGLDINLLDYYLSGEAQTAGVVDEAVTEIKYFTGISNTATAGVTVNMDQLRNGVLYVDEDSFHYQNNEDYQDYYDAQELTVSYVDQNDDSRTMRVNLPQVIIARGTPAQNYIVAEKGTTTDIAFAFSGINITRASQIGIYVEGEKLASDGSGSVNRYISSYVQPVAANGESAFGTNEKYIENLNTRLLINSTDNHYPVGAIPYRIAIDDFYQKSSGTDARAYIDYDVYVANVEGTKVYIPAPGDEANFPAGVGENAQQFTVQPMNINVRLSRVDDRYYATYANRNYVYDEVYSYWRRVDN